MQLAPRVERWVEILSQDKTGWNKTFRRKLPPASWGLNTLSSGGLFRLRPASSNLSAAEASRHITSGLVTMTDSYLIHLADPHKANTLSSGGLFRLGPASSNLSAGGASRHITSGLVTLTDSYLIQPADPHKVD